MEARRHGGQSPPLVGAREEPLLHPSSAPVYGYLDGVIRGNSGHLRVTVSDSTVVVDYVRAYRPASRVALRVYNSLGQVVDNIVDGVQPAGVQAATWNATSVGTGVYFYRLEAKSLDGPQHPCTDTGKLVLLR